MFRLALKNIFNRPLSLALSLVLFSLGAGLISALLLIGKQLEDQFDRNLAGLDLVIGAKGSPLQLILCNMYHIDAPTGNIALKEARPFLNPRHPLIGEAVPLSLGDNYKSYRIAGTTPGILLLYNARLAQGSLWQRDFEVVIGAGVAAGAGLTIGSAFHSSHGLIEDDNLVHDDSEQFRVVGILEPAGSVIDQLILTNTETVWRVHEHASEGHDSESAEEPHTEEPGEAQAGDTRHEHMAEKAERDSTPDNTTTTGAMPDSATLAALHREALEQLMSHEDQSITSILVKFRGRNYQTLNMPRSINENTNLQAAMPAIEINRLFLLLGVGIDAIHALAVLIMVVSGLSIFISLLNSLKDRKYELALLRVMGASRWGIFSLIIWEGVLVATVGYLLGALVGHISVDLLSGYMQDSYRYALDGWQFLPEEAILFLVCIVIGKLAALLPALQAYGTDIAATLTKQ